MTNKKLSHYFNIQRRYSRSINLERDLENYEVLEGYILTQRSLETLKRIITTLNTEEGNCAWTLTSVYGTGKSAFAHYLTSLLAHSASELHNKSLTILAEKLGTSDPDYQLIDEITTKKNLIMAVATGQREPISYTIIRALSKGVENFCNLYQKSKIKAIKTLETKINNAVEIDSKEIINLVLEITKEYHTGIFLVIDELGKNLEYASSHHGAEDLYVLQQLAELPKDHKNPIYILGILHQAFAEYGQRLASVQRNEWAKIQGRFEDIPFTESAGQMMNIIAQAINSTSSEQISYAVYQQSQEWLQTLESVVVSEEVSDKLLEKVYPLHPLTALVLPTLCQRYAQNDRSLFTFLTSYEPLSFRNFLDEVIITDENLPSLKLDRIYDYFIESAGMGLASRPNLQRWVEIQDLISDAKHLDEDSLKVLKSIGILNLITVTGSIRATRNLVALSMCDRPSQTNIDHGQKIIDGLLNNGLITHKRQLDELRIWQGSDFNVDQELNNYMGQEYSPLVKLLSDYRPLNPLVAQRHSYETGTLRYFERHYLDSAINLQQLSCNNDDSDGYIGYWVDEKQPDLVPENTIDNKPLIILSAANLEILKIRTREFVALRNIKNKAPELQTDGVARKEVNYRLAETEQFLDETLAQSFNISNNQSVWIQGEQQELNTITDFNSKLSEICDRTYSQSPILWNELINRRNLTSQGMGARRKLIEAMLENSELEKLGLEGYGPEVCMYYSVLENPEIHSQKDGIWGFNPPNKKSKNSNLSSLWEAIEEFCFTATNKAQTLDQLYQQLALPPLGCKQGVIPVILAAMLLHYADDLGVYQDGTFIPILGAEHFELLVKYPERFAVKYFEVVGLRAEVFKELEEILRNPQLKQQGKIRNTTLLTVVTPLYQFVKKLPRYTQQTQRIKAESRAILKALQTTLEPDELLFKELPIACNLPPIGTEEGDDGKTAKELRIKLAHSLREINTALDNLLRDCQKLIYEAFAIRNKETKLREDLRIRANYIAGKCSDNVLKRFIQAAADQTKDDTDWLKSLLMIIADKPVESWTDEDVTKFEINLTNLVRRFNNFEALQKEITTQKAGIEAQKITVTRPDGGEIHQTVWVDHSRDAEIDEKVDQILSILPDDLQLRQAILAKLNQKILNSNAHN
jgi:hypothetical protein